MLTVSRKPGESILIGDNITVMVTSIRGRKATLRIVAPAELPVDREEVRAKRCPSNAVPESSARS